MRRSRATENRKKHVPRLTKGRTPKVAKNASAAARAKLNDGKARLSAVAQSEEARHLIDDMGWPTSVDGFLQWLHIGNDTLYKTHKDLLPEIKQALAEFEKRARATPQLSRQAAKLETLQSRASKLEYLLQNLAGDLLNVSADRDGLQAELAFEASRADTQKRRADRAENALRNAGLPVPDDDAKTDAPKKGSEGRHTDRVKRTTRKRLRDSL